jgi:hypothetical protein
LARIRITSGGATRELPLAATTLLGRHRSCTWVLDDPRVPTFWVELRWTRAGWSWRELGAEASGPRRQAVSLPPEWWLIDPGQRINGRGVVLELLDPTPPERFSVEQASGQVFRGPELDALLAEDSDELLPADWERRPDQPPPLCDGSVFTVGAQAFRFHAAAAPTTTERLDLDLDRLSCQLELRSDDDGPRLVVWDGPVETEIAGAYNWALVPYLEARLGDTPIGGWLHLVEAHSRWLELCPWADSVQERVSQDRSRICRALRARGIAGAARLFQRRRLADCWLVRVGLEPEQLHLTL